MLNKVWKVRGTEPEVEKYQRGQLQTPVPHHVGSAPVALILADDDVKTARDIMHNIQYVHAVCSQAEACEI